MNGPASPSLMNLNGMMSPQSPFGTDGFPTSGSPALNMHHRQQSLQYPMLQHQQLQQQQQARASPRLQEVREDEEEGLVKSPSKTPEPPKQNPDGLQAEIDDAEYHLEEQLRNQLEHEDYNPQTQSEKPSEDAGNLAAAHERQASGDKVSEHFANSPGKPLVLHHPRPHSRGHSLTQNFFRDPAEETESKEEGALKKFAPMTEIAETQKGDDAYEIDTNPSNLGTPVHNFDFSATFGHHQKTTSTASNPWNDAASATSSARRSSHGSKPSLSKLNVKAPEFKFNPASTFTPGLFNFGQDAQPAAPTSQPAVFQAGTDSTVASPTNSMSQFGKSSRFHASAPSFSPGQSDFSFSTLGPKFRPDAPAFTPFQSLSASVTSAGGSGSDSSRRGASIFGNIDIKDIVKPPKKSKAIPIIRPSSGASVKSAKMTTTDDDVENDHDGRVTDDSRIKRARSSAPDGDDVPLFAEQPRDSETVAENPQAEPGHKDDVSAAEDDNADGDNTLPVDTSLSSIVTSDQMDTKATTAAPSETSPADQTSNKWQPFEFKNDFESQSFDQARPFGEVPFENAGHEKSLSAAAEPFVPGGLIATQEPLKRKEPDQPVLAANPAPPTPDAEAPLISLSPKPQPASGLGASRFAPKPKGLKASRFASSPPPAKAPSPVQQPTPAEMSPEVEFESDRQINAVLPRAEPQPDTALPSVEASVDATFEEIDAVMQQLENEPYMGVKRSVESPKWHQDFITESPMRDTREVTEQYLPEALSPTPRQYQELPEGQSQPMLDTPLEDPFVDPPLTPLSPLQVNEFGEPEHESVVLSDWEAAFSEDEHDKLESRAQFFDGRVNQVVGNLLASRFDPLEKTLLLIQDALSSKNRRAPSSRRDMRSVSAEPLKESDADDEDEEPAPRRSLSPRKDRRMEQMRVAVMEALSAQERSQVAPAVATTEVTNDEGSAVLKALEEMKLQLGNNTRLDFRGEDLKNIVEEAVQSRLPPTLEPDVDAAVKMDELQAKVMDLEQRLYSEQSKVEKEVADRRAADDVSAELNRKLQAAETRVEVEIINRSVFDQRVTDLEERLRHQEEQSEAEIKTRRMAEDRLSEIQRLLRISSEEEVRLREVVEDREHKVKTLEQSNGKSAMRMALLEAAQSNSTQSESEMTNKVNTLEADLRAVRQDNNHWRAEAERADETARRNGGELAHVLEENKHMNRSLDTITTQLEENERLRESWRVKFLSLQDDMGKAAREIAEDNARRIKKDQAMLARQEVLDARLQAEAKTRERLEVEMERLQMNERSGMRAVNECKRLEDLLGGMRTENHELEKTASRYQREFEEAREIGASEVKRTRMALQTEIDATNHQVNVIRVELEEQNAKLRSELDNTKLSTDTAKVQHEMLLEDAQNNKTTELEELRRKHQNEMEDLQARYEREVSNAKEDGQKTEELLLERLSLSSSKTDHLQDRILHLEDKLEIAKEAAAAAAQAAKTAGVEPGPAAAAVSQFKPAADRKVELPEKISPQALRESIMVLQEQLQAREQRIEELEQINAKLDPEAPTKISKRDDEISWLRELLAVRHGDLQDIIAALSGESYDRERVKDATIRLKANLQMEEQERERAINGGSAINLPNIAQSLQAATPRVAQSLGAAWGNWRKGSQPSFRSFSGVLGSPAGNNATPSKSSPNPPNNPLGGLLTPPASGLRQTPPVDNRPQPTAFASTGRRFTSQGSMSRSRGISNTSRRAEKMPAQDTTPPPRRPEREEPSTPPMMGTNAYDSDAQPGDFDDDGFFEEED